MNTEVQAETHDQFVARMNTERIELRSAIQRGDYQRAANIASIIGFHCFQRAELVKGKAK